MSDAVVTEVADAPKADDYEAWTAHWTKLVREWEAGGLSQAEFCRQRAIKLTTFNFWKLRVLKQTPGAKRHRKPREEHDPSAEAVKPMRRRVRMHSTAPFLPVVVRPNTMRSEWWCEIACRNGRVVRLREYLPPAEIKALLTIMES